MEKFQDRTVLKTPPTPRGPVSEWGHPPYPPTPGEPRRLRRGPSDRRDLSAGLEAVEIVGPRLHHVATFFKV